MTVKQLLALAKTHESLADECHDAIRQHKAGAINDAELTAWLNDLRDRARKRGRR